MADLEHNTRHGVAGAHGIHRWIHANQAARFAESVVSGDRGKVSWQTSDNTFWVLKDHTNVGNVNGWTAAIGAGAAATFCWGSVAAPATASARYITRTNAFSANINQSEYVCPVAGTRNVTITWSAKTPLATDSIVFHLMVNEVASALTATAAAAATSGTATATITLAAGDRLAVRAVQSSTEAQAAWNGAVTITVN